MMTTTIKLLFTFVLVGLMTGELVADELPDKERIALDLQLGLGTPVGLAGLKLTYVPSPWIDVGVGGGWGGFGPQAAAAVHGRFPLGEAAVTLGPGLSLGPYKWVEFTVDQAAAKESDLAVWLNAEASMEAQLAMGLRGGGTIGYGWMLNPNDLVCSKNIDHCENGHDGDGGQIFFIGLFVGFAFWLG